MGNLPLEEELNRKGAQGQSQQSQEDDWHHTHPSDFRLQDQVRCLNVRCNMLEIELKEQVIKNKTLWEVIECLTKK